ncbi:hypothetical protein ESOMN_v1c05720 [Williamsoniiplasma somnilux]|uniref:Uncharacterized protein n=1 Tax=Williamsoniiplasma somnilux TaxID=215578 RepID=A0A2K8NYY7_9MOLU|nr:hypothetical protein ESOMN_v1c05720 [Williamsoniiplasma somnilux]
MAEQVNSMSDNPEPYSKNSLLNNVKSYAAFMSN